MSKDYIPSAFPTYENNGKWLDISSEGMTLRDYFAAKAMQGMMDLKCTHPDELDFISIRSYEMADRMMKVRNQK